MYSFSYLEPVCCSMSSSNCCFLTCTQISQEAGQVVWYSHLFKNFPQFIVIHIVKGFGVVNKAEVMFFWNSCFLMIQLMLSIWEQCQVQMQESVQMMSWWIPSSGCSTETPRLAGVDWILCTCRGSMVGRRWGPYWRSVPDPGSFADSWTSRPFLLAQHLAQWVTNSVMWT